MHAQPAKAALSTSSEVGIFARVLSNGKGMTPLLARHILTLGFDEGDKARMNDLAARNQEGKLSDPEKKELQDYIHAGCLLSILHSKARKALKRATRR
jgi:hypothetical protein